MDFDLIQKLTEYCDQLVGETTKSKAVKTAKKKSKKIGKDEVSKDFDNTPTSLQSCKKKKKHTLNENTKEMTDNVNTKETVPVINNKELNTDCPQNTKGVSELIKESVDQPCNENLVTDDGFKIVSSIPEDDSDISDAFESDVEEDLSPQTKHALKPSRVSSREMKTTEDGFKIISDIPPDDSDVSDAFTDEEEYDGMGEDLVTPRKQLISEKTFSRPILQMIDDFGLGENILKRKQPEITDGKVSKDEQPETMSAVRNSKKKKKKLKGSCNTTTLAAKRKHQVEVTVYDYTKKRGTAKKVSSEELVVGDPQVSNTKDKLEKELKRMRFEIFKLGMTGFEKQKKKETRIALAVKLGAKPPKKENVSYKNLLVTKRQEKVKEKEKHEMNREMGIKEKKKFNKPKDKKKPRAYTAQVGKFKDGVQFLSKKDLAKIKRS